MKAQALKTNKPLKIIVAALLCTAFAAVTVYAAVLFSSWVVSRESVGTGELGGNTALTVNSTVLSFTNPGDTSDFDLTLANNSSSVLHYYYRLSITAQAADDSLSQAILVYYDGEFLGTLSALCSSGSAEIDRNQIIAAGLSDEHTLTFELHIAAEDSVYSGKTVTVKIESYSENIDYKKYIVVSSDDEFSKAVDDINSGLLSPNVVVALSSDIVLSKNYEINYPCVIDLEGYEMIIPSGKSIALKQSGTVKLTSSKAVSYAALSGTNVGNIALNGSSALLIVDDFFSGSTNVGKLYGNLVTLTSYDTVSATALLMEKFNENIGDGVVAGSDSDIFGALDFYAGSLGVASGDGYTYSAGVITAASDTVTKVTVITVGSTSEEFKIFGSGDAAVCSGILSGELAYMPDVTAGVYPTVTSDLFLPKSIKSKNATITWTSSDPATMTDDGKISDTVKDSVLITLYAEIRVGSLVQTKTFSFRVSSQNNETKFAYIIAQLSPITLDTVYTGTNPSLAYIYLPTVRELNGSEYSEYDYRANYTSPEAAQNNESYTKSKLEWEAYKDVKLEWIDYSITNMYNYISLSTVGRTVNSETHLDTAAVYLNTTVFYTYAQIEARGKFEGDDTVYTGIVNVIIKLGNETELQNMVFDHVQSQLNDVDILHNILETRRANGMANEKGDFLLNDEYMAYDISYSIPAASAETISAVTDNGDGTWNIAVNAEGFDTTETSIGLTVTIGIKSGYGVPDEDITIESRILYFTVPPAITPDNYGFSNDSVFNSVKYQVFQQLPATERITPSGFSVSGSTVTNTTGRYILLRDLIYCDTLQFAADETVSGTTNDAVYDLMRLIEWATGNKKVTAESVVTGYGSTVSDGKEYMTEAEVAVIKTYYQYVTGCSDAVWTTLLASAATEAPGYVISDGATLTSTISGIINNSSLSFMATDEYVYFKYTELMQWATNEKDFDSSAWAGVSGAGEGSAPNLGIITSRDKVDDDGLNYTDYGILREDNTEYITYDEKRVLIAYWYAVDATRTTTTDALCGDVFKSTFASCSIIPTYLNYNGANILACAMYDALDELGTIDLSSFVAEISGGVTLSNGNTLYYPHITNADASFAGLAYFNAETLAEYLGTDNIYTYEGGRVTIYGGLKTFYLSGEITGETVGLPAFLTTNALAAFYARLTSSETSLTTLVMQNCAKGHTEFDISQTKLLTALTYLDFKYNYGISNIGALLAMPNYKNLAYLDVAGCDVEDVHRIYTLKNICVAYKTAHGVYPTVYHTPDGGIRTLYLPDNDSMAVELTYLKEIEKIDSNYLQLCKKLVKSDGTSTTPVYWRIEQGNMMSVITAAGRFPEINTVGTMEDYAADYYYCSADFTYDGQNFTAGHVYKAAYSGNTLTYTDTNLTVTTTTPTAPTGTPSGTPTTGYAFDDGQPTYTATKNTTSTGGTLATATYNNRRILYGVDINGNTVTICTRFRSLTYTSSYTQVTYVFSGTGNYQTVYPNDQSYYYFDGDGVIWLYDYHYTVNDDATYSYTVTVSAAGTIYEGLSYTYGRYSTVGTTDLSQYKYLYVSNNTGTHYLAGGSAPAVPNYSSDSANWTLTGTSTSGWMATTSTYISPVVTLTSSDDAEERETSADQSSGYYYSGTTGSASAYDYGTESTHSYTNGVVYQLVADGNGFSWEATAWTQPSTSATTMESILAEANTHISDVLYGNYYGNYYYYTGVTATVNGRTYTNGNVYRLMGEVGGTFEYISGESNLGVRSTCTTVTSIATLQTLLLNATASDVGKVYYYTGSSDRTYAQYYFYEMTVSDTTAAYYLKHFGAVNAGNVVGVSANGETLLYAVDSSVPSRISNERYYVSGGPYYGGTGGTEKAVISAIVIDTDNVTHIRKFLVSVIG